MGPSTSATYRVGSCSYAVGEDPAGDPRKCPQDYSTASNPSLALNVSESKFPLLMPINLTQVFSASSHTLHSDTVSKEGHNKKIKTIIKVG